MDAPSDASENFGLAWADGRVLTCVRPLVAAFDMPRASVEIRRTGSNSPPRAVERLSPTTGFPDPVSFDRLPMTSGSLSSHPRQPRRRPPVQAAAAGARWTPPLAIKAQAMRAVLLASATVTSIGGLRSSMVASQEPFEKGGQDAIGQ